MTALAIGCTAAAVVTLGAFVLLGGITLPEPTSRTPVDRHADQDEFLETGRFTIEVPGKTIQIDGELVNMSCVRGKDLQGEPCGWTEVTPNGTLTFHPATSLRVIGGIVDVDESYAEVYVGEYGVSGIAKWSWWGDTTRAYRFTVEGGEYGSRCSR